MPYVKHCYYGPYKIYSHLWPYWLTTGDLRSKIDIMRKVRSMSAEVQPNMYVCVSDAIQVQVHDSYLL